MGDNQLAEHLNTCWIRIMACLNQAAIQALLDILHNSTNGLPEDQAQLFVELTRLKTRLHGFKPDRMSKLFPANQMTNSKMFDIPLLADIIIRCSIAPRSQNISLPDPDDILSGAVPFPPVFAQNQSLPNLGDSIKWLKAFRNWMDHYGQEPISEDLCDVLWMMLIYILQKLGYDTSNVQKYRTLKFIMQGPTRPAAVQAVLSFILLQDIPRLSFDTNLQSATSVTHQKKIRSLKGLFFEIIGELSLEELKS